VKAQPPEESGFVHRLDDRHHSEDEEDRLPVLIVESPGDRTKIYARTAPNGSNGSIDLL
jgi:hypothetical protein